MGYHGGLDGARYQAQAPSCMARSGEAATGGSRRLVGRTAIVTGAARGIGLAIAARLAREGAAVMLADIDAELAETEAAQLRREELAASAAAVDIADPGLLERLAPAAAERLGSLHILVDNAAIPDSIGIERLPLYRSTGVSRPQSEQPGCRAVELTSSLATAMRSRPSAFAR